jgi:hypothetical protein
VWSDPARGRRGPPERRTAVIEPVMLGVMEPVELPVGATVVDPEDDCG